MLQNTPETRKQLTEAYQEKLQEAEQRPVEPILAICEAHRLNDWDEAFNKSRDTYLIVSQLHKECLEKLAKSEEKEAELKGLMRTTPDNLDALLEEYLEHIQKQSAIKGAEIGLSWKVSCMAVLFEKEIQRFTVHNLLNS